MNKFDPKTRKLIRLTCDVPFVGANDVQIEARDYNGFTVKTVDGELRTFLLLQPHDGDHDAVDVTTEVEFDRFKKRDR